MGIENLGLNSFKQEMIRLGLRTSKCVLCTHRTVAVRTLYVGKVLNSRVKTELKKLVGTTDEEPPAPTRTRVLRGKQTTQTDDIKEQLEEFLRLDVEDAVERLAVVRASKGKLASLLHFRQHDLLDNEFYVTKEVQNCIRKGDLNRAIMVIRYAGENGTVGMNTLLAHLLKKRRPQVAHDCYKVLRKLGIPASTATYVLVAHMYDAKNGSVGRVQQVEQLVGVLENSRNSEQTTALRIAVAKAVASQYELTKAVTYFMDLENITSQEICAGLTRVMHRDDVDGGTACAVFEAFWTLAKGIQDLDNDTKRAFLAFALKFSPHEEDGSTLPIVDAAFELFSRECDLGSLSHAGDVDIYLRYLLAKGRYKDVVDIFERRSQQLDADGALYTSYLQAMGHTSPVQDIVSGLQKASRTEHFCAIIDGISAKNLSMKETRSALTSVIRQAKIFSRGLGSRTESILYPEILTSYMSSIVNATQHDMSSDKDKWELLKPALHDATGTLRRCIDEILERRSNVSESKKCLEHISRLCSAARPIVQSVNPRYSRWIDQLDKVSQELLPVAMPKRAELNRAKVYFYGERDLAIVFEQEETLSGAIKRLENFVRTQIQRTSRPGVHPRQDSLRCLW